MISQVITEIQDELSSILDENQMKCLVKVLEKHLSPLEEAEKRDTTEKNDMLPVFIAAKRVEGCSEKSLRYYESTIRNMLESIMLTLQKSYRDNPKFCVTAKSGANRVKFIMGGRRIKRLPPCLQHNANGTGCQGGAIISPQPSI